MKAVITMMIGAIALILSTSVVAQKPFPDNPKAGYPDTGIGEGDLRYIFNEDLTDVPSIPSSIVVHDGILYEFVWDSARIEFFDVDSLSNSDILYSLGVLSTFNDSDLITANGHIIVLIHRSIGFQSVAIDAVTKQQYFLPGAFSSKTIAARRFAADTEGNVHLLDDLYNRIVQVNYTASNTYVASEELDISTQVSSASSISDIAVWDKEYFLLRDQSVLKLDSLGVISDSLNINSINEFTGLSLKVNRINAEENGRLTITAVDTTSGTNTALDPTQYLIFLTPELDFLESLELPSKSDRGSFDFISEVVVDEFGNIYVGQPKRRDIHMLEYVNHPPVLKDLQSPKTIFDMANFGADGYLTTEEFSYDSDRIEEWNVNDELTGVIISGFEGDGEVSYDLFDDNSYSRLLSETDTLFLPKSELDDYRLKVRVIREDSVAEVNKLKVFYQFTDALGEPTPQTDTLYFNTYQGLLKFEGELGKDSWFFMTNYLDDVTYSEFFESLGIRTSGSIGSNNPTGEPNVFNYDSENEDLFPISDLNDTLSRGESFIFKVFEDDEPETAGIQGGWPKKGWLSYWEFGGIASGDYALRRSDADVVKPLQFSSNLTDPEYQGLNIIGNPFGQSWIWSNSTTTKNNVSPDIAIWRQWANNGDGAWEYPTYPDVNEEVELKPGEGFLVIANGENSEIGFTYEGTFTSQVVEDVHIASKEVVISKIKAKLQRNGYYDEISIVENGELGARYVRKMGNPTERFHEIYALNPADMKLEYISGSNNFDSTGVNIPIGIRSTLFDTAHISIDLESLVNDYDSLMIIETFVVQDTIRYYEENGEFVIPLVDNSGIKKAAGKLEIVLKNEGIQVSAEEEDETPNRLELFQNYPNPFNPSTRINYQVPETGKVQLKVFDMLGREVATLVNSLQSAGSYSVNFDAAQLSSGMYLYRIETSQGSFTKKMLLLK